MRTVDTNRSIDKFCLSLMNEDSLRIPVIVYLQSGENARGILVYRKEGPMIEIRDTGPITDTNGVQFQIVENETNLLPLKSNDRVNLCRCWNKISFYSTGNSK